MALSAATAHAGPYDWLFCGPYDAEYSKLSLDMMRRMTQGAPSCYFTEVKREKGGSIEEQGSHDSRDHAALPTLLALERTIAQRKSAAESGAGGTPLPSCPYDMLV